MRRFVPSCCGLATLAWLLVGCACDDRAPSDGGSDAASTRDAALNDADIDGGPPAPPVLPAQGWELSYEMMNPMGPQSIQASIFIDERAESGIVRAVIGGNGFASVVVFDIVEPGRLVGRSAFRLGVSIPVSDCLLPFLEISNPVLVFDDVDGDGIFEELAGVDGQVAPRGGRFSARTIVHDTNGPTVMAIPARPIATEGFELLASEPLDPAAVPYVEAAGRRFALSEDPSSHGSRWTLDLRSLPLGTGYALGFLSDVRDLAGNAAASVPTTTFDVRAPELLRSADGFETGLVGIAAEEGVRALTGAEMPLEGAVSAFATSRTVVSFTRPPDAQTILFRFRMHANVRGTFHPWFRVRGPDGRTVFTPDLAIAETSSTGTVAGFAFQSDPITRSAEFPPGDEPLTLEIELHGTTETQCSGGRPPTPEAVPLGITLDSFEVSSGR